MAKIRSLTLGGEPLEAIGPGGGQGPVINGPRQQVGVVLQTAGAPGAGVDEGQGEGAVASYEGRPAVLLGTLPWHRAIL
jgi:hypothetical protein